MPVLEREKLTAGDRDTQNSPIMTIRREFACQALMVQLLEAI